MEKYLSYAREYLDILSSDEVVGTMKAYGETIKEYVINDPLNEYYKTVEAYENFELGEDTSDYYRETGDSFYKLIRARFAEVRKQLDAIDAGTMPGAGEYDAQAMCPDWRDPNGGVKELDESAVPVESDVCGAAMLEEGCTEASGCFNHDYGMCQEDGTLSDMCLPAIFCAPCYPKSRCGGTDALPAVIEGDDTGVPVESDACGAEILALGCAEGAGCFSHSMGICQEDGSFSIPDCEQAAFCAPCFPKSRCAGAEASPDESAVPVESDACGAEILALGCADAGPCFGHSLGICQEDGSFSVADCQQAALCAPCFPNSRCGSLEEDDNEEEEEDVAVDESAVPVESDACGAQILALGCADAGPCFDHTMGICQEDGTFSVADCDQAAFCAACFPSSRCGSLVEGEGEGDEVEEEDEVAVGEEDESSLPEDEGENDLDVNPEMPDEEEESSSAAVSRATTSGIVVAGWMALLSGVLFTGINVA